MSAYENDALFKALNELGVIDTKVLEEARRESSTANQPLGDILLEHDLISDENLAKVIADLIHIPLIRLSEVSIPIDTLKLIPESLAKSKKIILFERTDDVAKVAMNDPVDVQTREFIQKKIGIPLKVYYATAQDIQSSLSLYSKDIETAFEDIIEDNVKQARGHGGDAEPPIINIVDTLLTYAQKNRASDVHIEPQDHDSLLRFRIDGILHDIVHLPNDIHPMVVTRIKVLAKLRTDEHQAAQDGKIQFTIEGSHLDIRVSIVPTTKGEKIVMRLLSATSRQFSLTNLGFNTHDLSKVEGAYKKPFGLILATGPTGSGKTTTLYAILKLLNKRDVNIATIEDPVEYEIAGINQIQVNPNTNLTFADGLRSIVRQDPDIILVGEIRDEETADIAVNAAMTGHLVLSTLHTNDAATAIPRFLDLSVEPFLVASTVNVIVGQRLVRKIHSVCRVSTEIEVEKIAPDIRPDLVKKIFGDNKILRLYKGKGCPICHDTGYEDRIGIYETLVVDEEIRKAIVERNDAGVIHSIAVKNGMKTMLEDGLEKVQEGLTTIEEVLRVTRE